MRTSTQPSLRSYVAISSEQRNCVGSKAIGGEIVDGARLSDTQRGVPLGSLRPSLVISYQHG
jgi:hypothetical protein